MSIDFVSSETANLLSSINSASAKNITYKWTSQNTNLLGSCNIIIKCVTNNIIIKTRFDIVKVNEHNLNWFRKEVK